MRPGQKLFSQNRTPCLKPMTGLSATVQKGANDLRRACRFQVATAGKIETVHNKNPSLSVQLDERRNVMDPPGFAPAAARSTVAFPSEWD